jgi:hypothetical protein
MTRSSIPSAVTRSSTIMAAGWTAWRSRVHVPRAAGLLRHTLTALGALQPLAD